MAIGYLAIGLAAGFLCALALTLSGFGFLAALGAFSGLGTLATLLAGIAGARCPEAEARAERA